MVGPRLRAFLATAAVAICLPGLGAGAASASPLDGNAMWIWYVSASGGSASGIARTAKAHDVRTVLVKSGDAGNYWSQFSSSLVRRLHERGLKVCAWQFVYGSNPAGEAAVGARAVDAGADCLIIDAEGQYEGRYAAADRYIRELRDRIGGRYPLVLAGLPYVDYHPAFPYSVFLGKHGAKFNAPQMYWRAIGTSVRDVYEHTYRYNRPYGRRIYPIGQTWQSPPREQITDFRKYAREYGARGVSWWSWQETAGRQWDWLGKHLNRGIPGFEPEPRYARLARGSRGDLVVQAQALLRAAGQTLAVDGAFGPQTEGAVKRFQRAHDLPVSGRVYGSTWRRLLQREPASVKWSQRSKAPAAPKSASLPAREYEIPQSRGRP